jgi:hypothetical protein
LHATQIVCGNETFAHTLHVQLDNNETECGNETDLYESSKLCAEFKNRDKCQRGCGAGSSSFCTWRSSKAPSDKMSQDYATCSPDFAFCPNGECDELEQLELHICPQDCTGDYKKSILKHAIIT